MSDNLSEAPTKRRDNAAVDGSPITNAKLAQICYILVCLHILLFNYLMVVHSNIYVEWLEEDRWVENFTAILFLMAAIALFASAWAERRIFPRCAYILGCGAMAFFAGEEISWGQRIIGFGTPAFLVDLNFQKEFNIHNIPEVNNTVFTKRRTAFFALGIAGCAAFFCRKERILGIQAPPILLTLAFLTFTMTTYTGRQASLDFLGSILFWHRALVLLLLMFALFSRNARLFVATVASMTLISATAYLDQHNHILKDSEQLEYMFGLIAFFYALVALPGQGAARRVIATVAAALKPAPALPYSGRFFNKIKRGYLTPWTAVCALIVVGSVGSAFLLPFHVRADAAAFKEIYALVRTVEPTARSNFDVYLNGRDLRYFKQPCNGSDVQATFFLSVFPANALDISVDRWQLGFENLDFPFHGAHRSMILDGACAAMVRLPTYEIASVSTGQYIIENNGATTNLWTAEFPVSP